MVTVCLMLISVAEHAWVAIEGVVGRVDRRSGRNGEFAVALVAVATGDEYRCVWWNACSAPEAGSRVAIRGSGTNRGDVSVATTTLVDGNGQPREHRLLDYYRSCLEAEARSDGPTALSSRALLVLPSLESVFTAATVDLDRSSAATRWMVDRKVVGRAESLTVCWPVLVVDGQTGPAIIPILGMNAVLAGDQLNLEPTTLEVDDDFLVESGLTDEERQAFRVAAQRPADSDIIDAAPRLLDLLLEWQLIPSRATNSSHSGLGDGVGVRYCTVVIARSGESSNPIRRLVAEFENLKALPEAQLRAGPLGVLLGAVPATNYPVAEPTPSVLDFNVEQEQAVSSAMTCPLTVVTGPPGTGKSQVLANAVAAALARNETVLLASKNNHAVDVVAERVRRAHPDAHVMRLGKREFLSEAAIALGNAIRRTPTTGPSLQEARAAWSQAHQELAVGAYATLATRSKVRQAIDELSVRLARQIESLPAGVQPLGADDDLDLLAVAHQRALASVLAATAAPCRWFWQRRSIRRLAATAATHTRTASSLVSSASAPALAQIVESEGNEAALATIRAIIVATEHSQELRALETEFALLPRLDVIEQQITDSFEHRLPIARDLFGAGWRQRFDTSIGNRAPLVAYQSKLAAAAQAGGAAVYQARDAAASAMAALPVWAVTSLAVGGVLPLRGELFDLVIIDEAAQSDIASAIPLLYRARRAMIIGDPNQLSHITSVGRDRDHALARFHELDSELHQALGYQTTSLYTAAASVSKHEPIFLRHHYRSHPQIAEFANTTFYGGALSVDTKSDGFLDGPAVRWDNVTGTYERGPSGRGALNRPEASRVLELLTEQLDELAGTDKSVGIVTPFRAHADHIKDRIAAVMPHVADRVTVDTAFGFQGDERDVILFSTVISSAMPNRLQLIAGQPNLVNVGLSRARARLIVVGDEAACIASGTVLADLAVYARSCQ